MNHSNHQVIARAHEARTETTSAPWQLAKGCAMSLRPRAAGVLRVLEGRAWATVDVSRFSPLRDSGDHFIEPGRDLALRAGQRVVVEAWPAAGASGISLAWEPAGRTVPATRWQTAVIDPLHEFAQGLGLALRAMLRLAAGLLGYSEYLAAGRGRVLPCWESNQP